MKNIASYPGDPFAFHEKVVESKRNSSSDTNYKQRIVSLNSVISRQFSALDRCCNMNLLHTLQNYSFPDQEKADLISLYSFKMKIFQELKLLLTTDDLNRVVNTCQNCTISEINSFDHYVPKNEFPEFIVNPKNLFPSCTVCNSFKNALWLENGKRKFLNLYLDTLPSLQYLFVEIFPENNSFNFNFFLENRFGIDPDLFALINSHYENLKLTKRFKENSGLIASELSNSIRCFQSVMDTNEIKNCILNSCRGEKLIYGFNYWKSILKEALIQTPIFIESINQF